MNTKKYALLIFLLLSVLTHAPNQMNDGDFFYDDAQSTTGPFPPPGVDLIGHIFDEMYIKTAQVITDIPAYIWWRGCGPTALGMLIGYYDTQGFPDLISGDASIQTYAVNLAISSEENYQDYCLPIDYYPNLLSDKSEPPMGDEHADNCIADFMKTSQSYYKNYYGWSWDTDIKPAFEKYVHYATHYIAYGQRSYFNDITWNEFMNEINNGRPMVFLVDTNGNGETDHFITVIGYNSDNEINYYGCYHTWDHNIHWYPFRQMASGSPWGIYSIHSFDISAIILPPKNFHLQRLENSFIFFKEYINRLNWETNEKNADRVLKYKLYRKPKFASDDSYLLIAEVNADVFSYDDRGFMFEELVSYRVTSLDAFGQESEAVEVSN